jgi:hypothetical protein
MKNNNFDEIAANLFLPQRHGGHGENLNVS